MTPFLYTRFVKILSLSQKENSRKCCKEAQNTTDTEKGSTPGSQARVDVQGLKNVQTVTLIAHLSF